METKTHEAAYPIIARHSKDYRSLIDYKNCPNGDGWSPIFEGHKFMIEHVATLLMIKCPFPLCLSDGSSSDVHF